MPSKTIAVCLCLSLAPLHAAEVEPDLYSAQTSSASPTAADPYPALSSLRPRPRPDSAGTDRKVQALAHAAYAGMAIGGLAASIATGGVAPAVGFGLVALINAWRLWKMRKRTRDP